MMRISCVVPRRILTGTGMCSSRGLSLLSNAAGNRATTTVVVNLNTRALLLVGSKRASTSISNASVPSSSASMATKLTVDKPTTEVLADADNSSVPPHCQAAPTSAQLLAHRGDSTVLTATDYKALPMSIDTQGDTTLPHPIFPLHMLEQIKPRHHAIQSITDFLAFNTIRLIRFNFDWMSGWSRAPHTVDKALTRIIFLETVAGVPGSIAATLRHLASLRRMKRDGAWINTLLAEAENERMHLLTAVQLKNPGPVFRALVFVLQGIFFNFYFAAYLLAPRFCHRLVGYLEAQAVETYTKILERIDNPVDYPSYNEWNSLPAPLIAKNYWKLRDDATMRDVILVIRADEDHHREVNHNFADIESSEINVYNKPKH